MIRRRAVLTGAAALLPAGRAAAVRVTPTTRHATVLVGAAEGSGLDAHARAFVPFLSRFMPGLEFTVHNLPGDGGMNAIRALMAAPPATLTLGWVVSPTLPARAIDRQDDTHLHRLLLLGAVEREPVAFVSPAAAPLDSLQDMIQRASADRDAIPLGTPPPGSAPHLAVLRLQLLAQTRLNIVTFPSAAAAMQAVLGANVSAAALGLSEVIEALRDGTLVGLGIAARNRFGVLPDMPVLQEAGLPLSATIRRGLAVPVGGSEEMANRLIAACRGIAADPDFQELTNRRGYLAQWMDGQAWAALMEQERADLAKLWTTDPWLPSSGG